ncbi:MAG: hypothetical protein IKF45_08385 [Lachnospiraceae bacterium]|nr:hypothetical protein [Lachnospiraceae bacterium]
MSNQKTEAKKVTLKAGLMGLLLCSLLMLCPVRAQALEEAPDPAGAQEDKWDAEKEKMLEALDTMREMGFSTTGILETAEVAYDKYVREQVEDTAQKLTDEAKEKAEDVTRQATEAVEEKAEEAAENLFEAFLHRLQKAFESLLGGEEN